MPKGAPRRAKRVYKPGEHAPVTGIYLVNHGHHRPPHRVIVLRGELLPPCRTCKAEVLFTIEQQASHVTHDFDFAGPGSLMLVTRP
jgi:hypothetical protein